MAVAIIRISAACFPKMDSLPLEFRVDLQLYPRWLSPGVLRQQFHGHILNLISRKDRLLDILPRLFFQIIELLGAYYPRRA
jgi:hypothetical protein